MTFKEKLQMEHPENVEEVWFGGCRNCPSTYGYEKRRDCVFGNNEEECAKCWNREMPNTEEFIEPKCTFETEVENAYKQGLNDAWELAQKIWSGKDSENVEIFGTKFVYEIYQLSPQEVLAKLKAYEEEQSKIEVGDVVLYGDKEVEILITQISGNLFEGFKIKNDDYGRTGGVYSGKSLRKCKKTGKHIDIKSILEQIGE